MKTATNIQVSILEKIKSELNITEEINEFGLYEILYKTRNLSHPDLVEEELKVKTTEKFKRLTELLTEMKIYLDNLKLKTSSQDLIIYEKNFDSIIDKNLILTLQESNKGLQSTLLQKKKEISRLKKVITKSQENKSEELNKKALV